MKNLKIILQYCLLNFVLCGPLAYAQDNTEPTTPEQISLLAQFFEKEKNHLTTIANKKNKSTYEVMIAYDQYQNFLDKELNRIYQTISKKLSAKQQLELKLSQKKWVSYRDSEFEFINNNWTREIFGNQAAIARGDYRANVIKQRLLQLLQYAENL